MYAIHNLYYILKCILCIVIPQMKKISEMITSPKWTLQKALNSKTLDKMTKNIFITDTHSCIQGQEEPRLNRRGLQTEGLNLNKFNSMTVDPEVFCRHPCFLTVPFPSSRRSRGCAWGLVWPHGLPLGCHWWGWKLCLRVLWQSGLEDQRLDLKKFKIAKPTFPCHDAKLVRKNNLVKLRI